MRRIPALGVLFLAAAFVVAPALADFFGSSADLTNYVTRDQAASMAPVQSVNGKTGAVAVPVYQRQVSTAVPVATNDGTVSWTFPTPFTSPPTCFYTLSAASTSYTFDFPQVTAISPTSVSLLVTAHPKTLSIVGLTLPITLTLTSAGAPAGTTITFSCLAPV